MTQDTVEREVFIRADIEHVWSLVSRTGFWVGETLRFDITAAEGETVRLDTPPYGTFPVRVERLRPPTEAVYSWASAFPGEDLRPGNSTRVEFTLVPQDGGVLLRVRESGFASLDLPNDTQTARRAENVAGWEGQLEQLRGVAERVRV